MWGPERPCRVGRTEQKGTPFGAPGFRTTSCVTSRSHSSSGGAFNSGRENSDPSTHTCRVYRGMSPRFTSRSVLSPANLLLGNPSAVISKE